MTPHELLEAFETLADAPDGVKRLRELVLQLAVRGKLVPQDPADEPADTFLAALANDRDPTAGGSHPGKGGKEGGLPTGWRLVAFGRTHINRDAERIPLSREERSLRQGPYFYYGASGAIDTIDDYLFNKPLLLVGEDGANLILRSTPIAYIAQGQYWVNNHAHVLDSTSEHSLRYLSIFINSINLEPYITGTAQPKLNQAKLNSIPCSFPPLAEQHRIVARVDELMGLLDRLEAANTVRNEVRCAARDAALAALRTAEDAAAVKSAWARISDQMDALFSTPEDVAPLRQTIRQLAIRGCLVPQSPSNNAASKAVVNAQEQLASQPSVRGRTATNEKIRGDAVLSVGEWGPRVIPEGWIETPLSSVTRLESGHTPDRAISQYWDGDFFWIGIQDARRHRGGTIFATEKRITQDGIDNSATRVLPTGTVCLSRTASVGYTVIMGAPMCTSQDFVNFVCTTAVVPRYLQLVLEAEYAALKRFAKGAVHLTIYFPEVKAFHILLPPVTEQHSILAKVDTLMALCDGLEARLTAAHEIQVQFAAAAVHHLDV